MPGASRSPPAHTLDGVELEAAAEGCKPTKQRPLVWLEEVVAPLQRRLECLLPCRRRMAPRAEHAEAVVESLRDRRGTECSQAPRGELQRERQAVESKADTGNVHRVLLVNDEARGRRVCPLDEEPHGFVAQKVARVEWLLGIRDVERRNPEHDLAWHAQRLAARGEDGELRRGAQECVREPGHRWK